MRNSIRNWRRRFFRPEIFSPGQPEALAQAPEEARFIWKALHLRAGRRVLDLCCGTGRHSVALAKRGADVVGLDATPSYVAQAKRHRHGRLSFMLGDMRRLPFDGEFDAVINLWTSFGYFVDPAEDLKTLLSVRRALKPGGLFLIDIMNASWLRDNFQPRKWQRRGDGSYLLEDSTLIGGADPRIESEWTILRGGAKPKRARLFVRQYDRRRLSILLRRAGLSPISVWGGLDGRRLDRQSVRLVILAKKLT